MTEEMAVGKKFNKPPQLEGYYYPPERAREARDKGRLLTLRLETSSACNLKCRYCYSKTVKSSLEMSYEELVGIINQAKSLGAESIIIIGGGEPTIYPRFRDLVRYIYSLKLVPVVFTNNQTMTKELAQFLYQHNVSVVIKLDSLDENIQDEMAGVKGASKKIRQGLQNLIEVGYTDFKERTKLGASFVVNKLNEQGIPEVWRFCRINKLFPNLEMMVPSEGNNPRDLLTQEDWKKLKTQLLQIDREEFGYDWLPYTPLLACGCLQTMYSVYITVKGLVRPCAGIEVNIANVNDYPLKEIIKLPFFKIARNIEKHLQGKCGNCQYHSECVGCRGLAYFSGRNKGKDQVSAMCSEDPSCFKAE